MDMIIPVLSMVVGMAIVAGLSASLYLHLPKALLRAATRHGRFFGLGAQNPWSDKPAGNSPIGGMDSLLGHSLLGQRA